MRGYLLWTWIVMTMPARAESSFQSQVQHLQAGQLGIDQALRQFGKASGFGAQDAHLGGQAEAPRPLFQVHEELKRIQLKQGRLLFGTLLNRLVVGPDGSPALIELDQGQGFGSGLRALGIAHQAATEGRVSIEVSRLLLPTRAVSIQATALDPEGAFGLEAQVWSHKAWAVAGAMASSFVSGLAAAQQTQTTSVLGFSQVQPTGRNAVLQGVAQSAADQSKRLIEEATADKPVLVIEAGTAVTILVQEEVRW